MNTRKGLRKPKSGKRSRTPKQDLVESSRMSPVKGNDLIKVSRTTDCGPYTMVPNTGFNGVAFDLEMGFSLQNTTVYLGGALTTTFTNPGYTDIVNMFQEWKIDEVEVMVLYSNNASQINNISNLPILNVVTDYTSLNAET